MNKLPNKLVDMQNWLPTQVSQKFQLFDPKNMSRIWIVSMYAAVLELITKKSWTDAYWISYNVQYRKMSYFPTQPFFGRGDLKVQCTHSIVLLPQPSGLCGHLFMYHRRVAAVSLPRAGRRAEQLDILLCFTISALSN